MTKHLHALATLALSLALLPLLGAEAPPGKGPASGTVAGTVKDDTGGIIPNATVTLKGSTGTALTATTGADGGFSLRRVPAGSYTVTATYTNLQQRDPVSITITPGQQTTANLVMTVAEQKQEVTVTADSGANQVSVDPERNASGLVLKQEDLDALPDDPDDLEADLQALAGPSAGPGGAQIYIDGFTGGRLPPKASIREIRINSNPFSAEFDKLGFGRIQIFTKPGSDKFHGQAYYNISDGIWNSRNPFLSTDPPFRTQLFGGNVSGPITKHASFFIDVERRNIDDNGIINASIPSASYLTCNPFEAAGAGCASPYQIFASTPQRRTTVSPRVDYQLGQNNTLSFRYEYTDNSHPVSHLSAFDLPGLTFGPYSFASNGTRSDDLQNEFQVVETAVLSPTVVNETHFEYRRETETTAALSTTPQLDVSQSFVVGGAGYSAAGVPNALDTSSYYEIQNYTSVTHGAHTIKFGARLRADWITDRSPQNFNGTYAFLGGNFPVLGANNQPIAGEMQRITSLQQFIETEQLLNAGYTSAQVAQLGYGPSKFSINAGNPTLTVSQVDVGPFIQDDWRVKPNLTLNFGLRYEVQTNISDWGDFAPRVGFAWAPSGGSVSGLQRPKTVIRGGWGYFYDRFSVSNVLTALRYARSSGSQTVYTIDNPSVFNAAFNTTPPLSALTASNSSQFYQIDPNLKAPRVMQTVIGVDRQITSHTSLSLNVIDTRGTHELLTDDINAPVPDEGALPPGAALLDSNLTNTNTYGVRPYGNIGDIYDYQSVGIFKQFQAMANFNTQIGKNIMLFGRYSYQQAHADTDGLGSMPANPYDIAADYGRSQLDMHHMVFFGGSVGTRWGIRLSPFLVAHSGQPYNITTGTDLFLVGQINPTARPEVVPAGTPGAIDTRFGWLNPLPSVGAPLLERNFATGPGFIGLNLRLSKTFGFGTTKFEGPSGGARAGGGRGRGPWMGGPGESTEHRYNFTLSVNARNVLNHENLNTPNGSMSSPFFTQSTGITGGFGPEATASNQRRIDLQLRFSF